jgi:peptide/nickel transport system permease protein
MMPLLRRLLRRKAAVVGGSIILVVLLGAILAGVFAPYAPDKQDLNAAFEAPSAVHLMGTDDFGRDIWSRVVYGSRVSLAVGVIAVGIGATVGIPLGAVAGYRGGWFDHLVVMVIDITWSFPTILLAIALVAVLKPGLMSAMIALGVVSWPSYARVVRSQVLSLKTKEFTLAAAAMGARPGRILFRHILPNALSPVIVMVTLGMADAILVESTLSYFGLGAQPPTPSWGSMLAAGRNFMAQAPWMSFIPGVAIILVVLGFNLAGDSLRDVLDPHMKDR